MENIKTMKEFIAYIARLVRQGVNVTGITIEKSFYYKISKFPIEKRNDLTCLGIPVVVLRRPSYTYKEDFKIHYPYKS